MTEQARAAVLAHLDAFNRHDTDALIAGFTEDAVWTTGQDTFRGVSALRELFDDGLWALRPELEVVTLLADGAQAAARLRETLTVDGADRTFTIAVFFEVQGALIRTGTVYREGSADID